jgi:Cu(I)/Ag(I) efflux system periplasmic protein CusF
MKSLHTTFASTLLALAAVAALPGHAQTAAPASTEKAAAAELSDAEVRRVDKENRKITLKHGPIKNLDMPPMTMVFQVSDPALLDKLQAGDKVRFAAKDDAGKLTVTRIEPAK